MALLVAAAAIPDPEMRKLPATMRVGNQIENRASIPSVMAHFQIKCQETTPRTSPSWEAHNARRSLSAPNSPGCAAKRNVEAVLNIPVGGFWSPFHPLLSSIMPSPTASASRRAILPPVRRHLLAAAGLCQPPQKSRPAGRSSGPTKMVSIRFW